jgi:hypothetical protein
VTSRTIILNDSECRDVTAALQLLIDHCDVLAANGPADSFSSRRQNCQALLQKLRSEVVSRGVAGAAEKISASVCA